MTTTIDYSRLGRQVGWSPMPGKHHRSKPGRGAPNLNGRIHGQHRKIVAALAALESEWRSLEADRIKSGDAASFERRLGSLAVRRQRLLEARTRFERMIAAVGHQSAPAQPVKSTLQAPMRSQQPAVQSVVIEPAPEQPDLGVPLPAERIRPDNITYPSREGQQRFRAAILEAYGRCVVTGCQDEAALQAAHVIPYVDDRSNVVRNGICLRADIHCLYDRNLIRIGSDGRISVDPSVRHFEYRKLDGAVAGITAVTDRRLLAVRHRFVGELLTADQAVLTYA